MSWRWLEICQHHRTWLKRTNMCTYTNVEDSRNSTYSSLFGKIMITEKPWNFGLPSFETKAYWWTAASSLTLESPLQAQWNPRQYRISFYIISYYIIVYYIIISILYHTILHYIYMLICIYPHQLANSPHFWDQPPICLSDCRTGLPQVLQWWTSLSLGATWDWPVSIRCVSKNSHDIIKLSLLISTSIRMFMAWSTIFCWWPSGNLT